MSSNNAVSKIFWPAHLCKPCGKSGYIVGWNLRSFISCVATVVTEMELSELDSCLSQLQNDTHPTSQYLNQVCCVPPIILGILVYMYDENGNKIDDSEHDFDIKQVAERKSSANIWMTVDMSLSGLPNLRSIYCCGYRYHSLSSEILFYNQPNAGILQFMSMDPMVLDIAADDALEATPLDPLKQRNHFLPKSDLVEKLHNHASAHSRNRGNKSPRKSAHISPLQNEMTVLVNQMNNSYYLHKFVAKHWKTKVSSNKTDYISIALHYFNKNILYPIRSLLSSIFLFVYPLFAYPIIVLLLFLRIISEGILIILNWKLVPGFFVWGGLALKDVSATCQQVDLRLQQGCFWPWQWMLFRRKGWKNSLSNRAQYINFYNSMWLIANDIIIGIAIGTFLVENNQLVADFLNNTEQITVDWLKLNIIWLMGWPAGLKLNTNLDNFLGELFLWLIRMWTVLIQPLKPFMPKIISAVGLTGVAGASMILSLFSDICALMTIHLFIFYSIAARIFNWQLNVLWSLFNLFRGKKYNVLRHRLDSNDYDLGQLLLGTILFTLLFFLFPTVVVYYVLFCCTRLVVIFIQIGLKTILAVLNHFPLFALMLRYKDPYRLPGGIRLEIITPDSFDRLFDLLNPFRIFLWPFLKTRPVINVPTFSKSSNPHVMINEDVESEPELKKQSIPTIIESSDVSDFSDGEDTIRSRRKKATALSKLELNKMQVPHKKITMYQNKPTDVFVALTPVLTSGNQPNLRNTSFLFIKNIPIQLSSIFFQYLLLWRRLTSYYISMYVIQCLIFGKPIRPVPVLQYPMLPGARPSISTFWSFVRDSFGIH